MGLVAMDSDINWDEVMDKKARGIDDNDLGEVQEVQVLFGTRSRLTSISTSSISFTIDIDFRKNLSTQSHSLDNAC
jgi:hypothetical protein